MNAPLPILPPLSQSGLRFFSVCQLSADQNVVVAQMNAAENDVPVGYDVVG